MVEQSILDSQPIISISLQYRLGALGYLLTPEPGNANLAMNDQRNALIWIQKFVEGFGGNHENVTVRCRIVSQQFVADETLAVWRERGFDKYLQSNAVCAVS
jgi:hypothetical protein